MRQGGGVGWLTWGEGAGVGDFFCFITFFLGGGRGC